MAAIEFCWRKNKNLGHYNFSYNNIFDNDGLQKIIEWLGPNNHVFKVEVSERAGDQYAALQEALSNNKPKKGKKGKKGKKKKQTEWAKLESPARRAIESRETESI
jgi:hypothetical protein